jgi:hypothetical protein
MLAVVGECHTVVTDVTASEAGGYVIIASLNCILYLYWRYMSYVTASEAGGYVIIASLNCILYLYWRYMSYVTASEAGGCVIIASLNCILYLYWRYMSYVTASEADGCVIIASSIHHYCTEPGCTKRYTLALEQETRLFKTDKDLRREPDFNPLADSDRDRDRALAAPQSGT